jgi:hypothetical protein
MPKTKRSPLTGDRLARTQNEITELAEAGAIAAVRAEATEFLLRMRLITKTRPASRTDDTHERFTAMVRAFNGAFIGLTGFSSWRTACASIIDA